MKKTFLLGVGTEKSGTTFLANQLKNTKNVEVPLVKEHNIFSKINFDISNVNLYNIFSKQKIEKINKNFFRKENFLILPTNKKATKLINILFSNLPFSYFDYFEILLSKKKISFDFTPNYSALDKSVYKFIKSNFKNRGIRTKVIFLMREPVNRLLSMVKMIFRQKNLPYDRMKITESMYRFINYKHFPNLVNYERERSDYKNTIEKLKTVFPKKDIFYGFYENWNDTNQLNQLYKFLDIDLNSIKKTNRLNFKKSAEIKLFSQDIANFEKYYQNDRSYIFKNFKKIESKWTRELKSIVL